jgi:hypothetical protein
LAGKKPAEKPAGKPPMNRIFRKNISGALRYVLACVARAGWRGPQRLFQGNWRGRQVLAGPGR